MSRTDQQEETEDPIVRRSGRKRKLKRFSDFDYECLEAEESSIDPKQLLEVRNQDSKQPDVRVKTQSAKFKKPSLSAIQSYRKKPMEGNFNECSSEKQEKPKRVSNPQKGPKVDLKDMSPIDIINMHCEVLERRLTQVAHDYLEQWAPLRPDYVAPHSFLGGDPGRYSPFESNDAAVRKVVNDMLDVVSLLFK